LEKENHVLHLTGLNRTIKHMHQLAAKKQIQRSLISINNFHSSQPEICTFDNIHSKY
jgi:hypothetical protein